MKEVKGGVGTDLLMWGMSLGGLNLSGERVRYIGKLKFHITAKGKSKTKGVMNYC